MPIYEYQCRACGHQLEEFQKISDAPLIECPKCHQQSLNKLISAAGFQLKGSGWYITDYKDKAPSNKQDTNTDSSKTTETQTETASESKKESKKESKTDKSDKSGGDQSAVSS